MIKNIYSTLTIALTLGVNLVNPCFASGTLQSPRQTESTTVHPSATLMVTGTATAFNKFITGEIRAYKTIELDSNIEWIHTASNSIGDEIYINKNPYTMEKGKYVVVVKSQVSPTITAGTIEIMYIDCTKMTYQPLSTFGGSNNRYDVNSELTINKNRVMHPKKGEWHYSTVNNFCSASH